MTLYEFLYDIISWLFGLLTRFYNWLKPGLDTILPDRLVDFFDWIIEGITSPTGLNFFVILSEIIVIIIITLLNVIMFIWVERKFISRLMDRRGPMVVGYAGLLQNVADGAKLFTKENIIPKKADKWCYLIAPSVYVGTSLLLLVAIPMSDGIAIANIDAGLVFIFAVFSLAPFMIFIASWSSNNKYTLIGGMRSAAQMIAYEIPLILSVIGVIIIAGSFSLSDIVRSQSNIWYALLLPIGFIVFLTAVIAEVERIPFDLPEAEAELVEGWGTEYGGMKFGLIMFTEYIRGYAGTALAVCLFLGGWRGPFLPGVIWFLIKVYLVFMVFVWVRAALPRVRIDQLLGVGWKRLLPLSLLSILMAVGWVALKAAGWISW